MKIYFTASLSGKKIYGENYKKIVKILTDNGYKVLSSHFFEKERKDIEKESLEERKIFQKEFISQLNQADLMVAEISFSSTAVGHQITQALDRGKPVLGLYVEGKTPTTLFGDSSEKFILSSYSLGTLSKELPNLLNEASEYVDVRFNFFVPPQIVSYLDWITKHRRLPRAVFLRRLIEDHMARNKEYKTQG